MKLQCLWIATIVIEQTQPYMGFWLVFFPQMQIRDHAKGGVSHSRGNTFYIGISFDYGS